MKIFCSGIGGIGLSAYAAYQKASGHEVIGSDREENALISDLRKQGIPIAIGQDGSAIPKDTDLFVHTLALPKSHPELIIAVECGIPCMTYFQALGALTKSHMVIAVAGTHGKSSTTAMAAKVLIDSDLHPSVILGTKTADLGGRNWLKGDGDLFLVEACEYYRSFLHLAPTVLLVTNVTGDHFDAYRDMEDYRSAFRELIGKLPVNGALITHCSDAACAELTRNAPCSVIDADTFPLEPLLVPGKHMQKNAQLVLGLASHLRIRTAERSLHTYNGCWRRSEIKGKSAAGALIIDDYGHHPNEIKTTLEGIRDAYRGKRLICVLQPHTHDRVLKLYHEFTQALGAADLVIIPNIFEARSDRDSAKADPRKLAEDIAIGSSVETHYAESIENAELMLKEIVKANDVIVTMGAGDVWKIADRLVART
ncbi:MAG TPA: Mur ligase domain-containing protein [Candidatus Peribacterales bacterium]|nr:Mur ligase domain-containing protein [Candidatus Peribacterales bacterium]